MASVCVARLKSRKLNRNRKNAVPRSLLDFDAPPTFTRSFNKAGIVRRPVRTTSYFPSTMETSLLSVYSQTTSFMTTVTQSSPAKSTTESYTPDTQEDASEDFRKAVTQLHSKPKEDDDNKPFELTKRSMTVKSRDDGYGFTLRGSAPVIVGAVRDDSSADDAGLRRGDLIMKMNGHDVSSRSHGDLVNLINYMPESPLTFTVLSPDYIHSTDSELRRAWARHHLPNFVAASSQQKGSASPFASQIRQSNNSPTAQVRQASTGRTPTPTGSAPPVIRPRGESSASAVQRYAEQTSSGSSVSNVSKTSSGLSALSPASSSSISTGHSASADVDMDSLDDAERKKMLLRKGTFNIFAAPTTPARSPASSAPSSQQNSPMSSLSRKRVSARSSNEQSSTPPPRPARTSPSSRQRTASGGSLKTEKDIQDRERAVESPITKQRVDSPITKQRVDSPITKQQVETTEQVSSPIVATQRAAGLNNLPVDTLPDQKVEKQEVVMQISRDFSPISSLSSADISRTGSNSILVDIQGVGNEEGKETVKTTSLSPALSNEEGKETVKTTSLSPALGMKSNSDSAGGQRTPNRPPPTPEKALQQIMGVMNRRLPPRASSLATTTSSSDQSAIGSRDRSATEPTKKSPHAREGGEVAAGADSVVPKLSTLPPWQWKSKDVMAWMTHNGFGDVLDIDIVKNAEGLQLLTMKANYYMWERWGDEGCLHFLRSINNLRNSIGLDKISWTRPMGPLKPAPILFHDEPGEEALDGVIKELDLHRENSGGVVAVAMENAQQSTSLETRVMRVPSAKRQTITSLSVSQRPPSASPTPVQSSASHRNHLAGHDVSDWTEKDVDKWLLTFGQLEHMLYSEVFAENAVTGHTLLRLDNHKLVAMGISDPTVRKQMLREVERLRLVQEEKDIRRLLAHPMSRTQLLSTS